MDDGADCNVENVDWMYRIDLGVPQLDCLDPGSFLIFLKVLENPNFQSKTVLDTCASVIGNSPLH